MQIDIIERDGKTVIVADRPAPAECQLEGKPLADALIAEIQDHAEALASGGPEDYCVDGVMRSLFWSSPEPHECSIPTLSTILMQASYLLAAQREGLEPRLALRTLPEVPSVGQHHPTRRTGANSARSSAIATRLR